MISLVSRLGALAAVVVVALAACAEDLTAVNASWTAVNEGWQKVIMAGKKALEDADDAAKALPAPAETDAVGKDLKTKLDGALSAHEQLVSNLEQVATESKTAVEKATLEKKVLPVQTAIDKGVQAWGDLQPKLSDAAADAATAASALKSHSRMLMAAAAQAAAAADPANKGGLSGDEAAKLRPAKVWPPCADRIAAGCKHDPRIDCARARVLLKKWSDVATKDHGCKTLLWASLRPFNDQHRGPFRPAGARGDLSFSDTPPECHEVKTRVCSVNPYDCSYGIRSFLTAEQCRRILADPTAVLAEADLLRYGGRRKPYTSPRIQAPIGADLFYASDAMPHWEWYVRADLGDVANHFVREFDRRGWEHTDLGCSFDPTCILRLLGSSKERKAPPYEKQSAQDCDIHAFLVDDAPGVLRLTALCWHDGDTARGPR